MTFKVYTVSWYVDATSAATDATLTPFVGQASSQLSDSGPFYEALISGSAKYDR